MWTWCIILMRRHTLDHEDHTFSWFLVPQLFCLNIYLPTHSRLSEIKRFAPRQRHSNDWVKKPHYTCHSLCNAMHHDCEEIMLIVRHPSIWDKQDAVKQRYKLTTTTQIFVSILGSAQTKKEFEVPIRDSKLSTFSYDSASVHEPYTTV